MRPSGLRWPTAPRRATRFVAGAWMVTVAGCHEPTQPVSPAEIQGPLVGVSTSGMHTCAVGRDGATYCWGDGGVGQLGVGGRRSSPVPALVLGPGLTSVSAGAAMWWPEYADQAAGGPLWAATCGLGFDGAGHCWGAWEAVGAGVYPCAECGSPLMDTPTEVSGGLTFRSIVVGPHGSWSCGVSDGFAAYCWGPEPSTWLIPEEMRSARGYAPSFLGACALTLAGEVVCHGSNRFGEAGVPWTGPTDDRFATGDTVGATVLPFPSTTVADTLVASASHVCALSTAGEAFCWGRNDEGQLGTGAADPVCGPVNSHACPDAPAGPRRVAQPRPFVRISAGTMHTCAVADDGSAWCWGRNQEGQLGSAGDGSATPRAVATSLRFREISAGGYSTCAIDTDGRAWCWGDNRWGQLGTGDRLRRDSPTLVSGQRE